MGKPVQARFHLYPKSCTVDRMISKGSRQKKHTFIAVKGLFFSSEIHFWVLNLWGGWVGSQILRLRQQLENEA